MEDRNDQPVNGYPALTVMGYPPYHPEFLQNHNPPIRAPPNLAASAAAPRNTPPPRRSTGTASRNNFYNPTTRKPLKDKIVCIAPIVILVVGIISLTICVLGDDPGLHPPKFQVNSASVSPFNVSASNDDATASARWWKWNISFDVRNPNKDARIFYEQVEASIFYKQVNLSSMAIAPFYQYGHDRRSLEVSMSVTNWDSMTLHGAVNLTMTIEGVVRINDGDIEGHKQKMKVTCEDVQVGFSYNTTAGGTMLGESRECRVHCE